MDNKYPIAKADRQPVPLPIVERRQKWYRKNRVKISKRNKIHYWEKLRLPPKLWTRWNISQRVELCSQCRMHKPVGQFIRSFTRICIMCRKPNLPPIDENRLTMPVK